MAYLQGFVLSEHPHIIFNGAAFVLALISLTSTPSFRPLVLLLTSIHLYIRVIHRRGKFISRVLTFWVAVSLAGVIANISTAMDALSNSSQSWAALGGISLVETGIALLVTFFDVKLSGRIKTPWAQMTFFPILWASSWTALASISPIGRLLMWSPVQGFESYEWITRVAGPPGIDWVTAACAVVLSQAAGAWLMGPGIDDNVEEIRIHELDAIELPQSTRSSQPLHVLALVASLAALTLPSFFITNIPLAISSAETTPLTVGCVLPHSIYDKSTGSALEDFIAASKQMNSAKVLVWPESAVTFNNADEKNATLERIRHEVPGPYIGVSFEEFVIEPGVRAGTRRNGFALLSPNASGLPSVLMQYYKRNLVPIVETFSLTPGQDPPTIYHLDLTRPGKYPPSKWSPVADHTRPIPLTASICLDFSSPYVFSELQSRPALILAPGRTWHPGVGLAMWEQAKARAEEMGSMVLWCDGGEGGVSGIAGGGMNDPTQVGQGSWVRSIGLEWPFNEDRTFYARWGDSYTLLFFWIMLGGGWIGDLVVRNDRGIHAVKGGVDWITRALRQWREQRRIRMAAQSNGERQSLLD